MICRSAKRASQIKIDCACDFLRIILPFSDKQVGINETSHVTICYGGSVATGDSHRQRPSESEYIRCFNPLTPKSANWHIMP